MKDGTGGGTSPSRQHGTAPWCRRSFGTLWAPSRGRGTAALWGTLGLIAAALILCGTARAVRDGPSEALPEAAEGIVGAEDRYAPGDLSAGVGRILDEAGRSASGIFRERLRGTVPVLLAAVLCGTARGAWPEGTEGPLPAVPLAGALAVTALSAGDLEDLIGLGWKTIRELDRFSRALLPVLAAATAASGASVTATVQQAAALALAKALMGIMDGVLMPLTYLYIGVLTASCALPGGCLDPLAAALRRIVTAVLGGSLLVFTVYLSISGAVSGPADAAAVRVTKAAVANLLPVVGGIVAEASEAVLAGAGALRSSIGVFGTLAVLAACVGPVLRLGIQYLLYKGAAAAAAAVGTPELCRLIDGLAGAFALVLGMTGSCAALLLLSILSFVTAVSP